jgi:hypothetical protein
MVSFPSLSNESLKQIADDVARSLSYAEVENGSAYITTAVNYPSGTAVVVRLDPEGDEFFVSDDGGGAIAAELFGAGSAYPRVAGDVARRFNVHYDRRSFFVLKVGRGKLPAAVALIANASANAVEHALMALDKQRAKVSRELFVNRITEAFGNSAAFDVKYRGTTKVWDLDAAVTVDGNIAAVFEYVTPALASVAFAHMKVGDISAMIDRPRTAIVLSDYDRTDPPLRQILSSSADAVFSAAADIREYQSAA